MNNRMNENQDETNDSIAYLDPDEEVPTGDQMAEPPDDQMEES